MRPCRSANIEPIYFIAHSVWITGSRSVRAWAITVFDYVLHGSVTLRILSPVGIEVLKSLTTRNAQRFG